MKKRTLVAVGLVLLCAGGCTTYYKVTDPTTGRAYYTTELQHKNSGAATLKDARTGNKVNLQNSEVQTISKEEFESGKNTPPPPTTAAPAPAAASVQTNPFK
jgi:hypothetical protein